MNKQIEVKIKRLHENAVIPRYATEGSAGMDLTAVGKVFDTKLNCWVYDTGWAFEIPEGYVGLVFPRSSVRETECYMANCVAVIDSDYRGEVKVSFKDRTEYRIQPPYEVGDRCGQIIILPYPKVSFILSELLSETQRGTGGHGSTGK